MDGTVWVDSFVNCVWQDYVDGAFREPLALYVDNFKSHVSEASINAFGALGTEIVPLPKNTTAVLQPLDVGIMGPFKMKMRSAAIAAELQTMDATATTPLRERLLQRRTMPAQEKRRAIAEKVIAAWASITESSIRSAWSKSGLYTDE
jgi:hypothetical protein